MYPLSSPVKNLQPIYGLDRLYEVSMRLTTPVQNYSRCEYVATLIAPVIEEALTIVDLQVSGLEIEPKTFRQRPPSESFDYGHIRAIASHCIVLDETTSDVMAQVNLDAENEDLEVDGWLLGAMLGYELSLDQQVSDAFKPIIPEFMNGIWLRLSAVQPTSIEEPFVGTLVEIPDCRLFNPMSTLN